MAVNRPLMQAFRDIMIKDVPSYGNKFLYSLGFLSMIAFFMLIASGVIMVANGPNWWLTSGLGTYTRSVHLWATQAFVLFILLHLLTVFFTSGFRKPRRLTWVLGVMMLAIVLAETEFGYALRGDYSSQWRSLQGADFYNGSGLGKLLNPLNYGQIYGIHVAVVPLALLGLLFLHYLLVRVLGIARPYRQEVVVRTVAANHRLLFARGGVAIAVVLILAFWLPSPYIKPVTIADVARNDPQLLAKSLVAEFDRSSDTATYRDNIDPYTYDTRAVYIAAPYGQFMVTQVHAQNALETFNRESAAQQQQQLQAASDYYNQEKPNPAQLPAGPVTAIVSALTTMAQAGLYEPALTSENSDYAIRFLSDTGVLEDKAALLAITTDQYGMVREESGRAPGAWWLLPIGILNHTLLTNDNNGDRDGAIILGSVLLTLLAFPFVPYVNQLPDKLKLYKVIWRERPVRS